MDMTRHYHNLYGEESKDQKIKRLYAENERLREALQKIANGYSDEDNMRNIARSALSSKGD